jgi:hypothetical protein
MMTCDASRLGHGRGTRTDQRSNARVEQVGGRGNRKSRPDECRRATAIETGGSSALTFAASRAPRRAGSASSTGGFHTVLP